MTATTVPRWANPLCRQGLSAGWPRSLEAMQVRPFGPDRYPCCRAILCRWQLVGERGCGVA